MCVSARLLRYHAEYVSYLADFFIEKAMGNTERARAAYEKFRLEFGKHEVSIEAYYDHYLAVSALNQIAFENDHGF